MDDFIDDSDAKIDISAEIRNIFGYDRRKFRDEVITLIFTTIVSKHLGNEFTLDLNQRPFDYFYTSYYRRTLTIGLWKTIDLPTS